MVLPIDFFNQNMYSCNPFFHISGNNEDVIVHGLYVPWDCHNIRRMFRESCDSHEIHNEWFWAILGLSVCYFRPIKPSHSLYAFRDV